jgi:hypothetical protein
VENIIMDLLKAFLGNASVSTFLWLHNNRWSGVFSVPYHTTHCDATAVNMRNRCKRNIRSTVGFCVSDRGPIGETEVLSGRQPQEVCSWRRHERVIWRLCLCVILGVCDSVIWRDSFCVELHC